MGKIHEQVKHEPSGIALMVVERAKHECRDPWQFVSLEADGIGDYMTPKQLRELGQWLVNEGKRLGKQFRSNGQPKTPTAGT